jgi:amino acid adenylation domain-containing protein
MRNLLELFEKTVETKSHEIAIVDYNDSSRSEISFRELNNKSDILSSLIYELLNKCNRPIAVLLPKSINAIITNLAISKSGNIYMNLDVKTPGERIKNIINQIKPELVITSNSYLDLIAGCSDLNILDIDKVDFSISKIRSNNIWKNLIDTDPYCIINTSGSTGTPKGVVLNHRSFIDFLNQSNEAFSFGENPIIGSLSPLIFDIYSFELCLLISKGSKIVILPDKFSGFPIKLLEILKLESVSFIFWVPTIMVNIANMDLLKQMDLPELKLVWFAGEVFPTKQFNYWYNKLTNTVFANLYGPIEITLDCTYFIIDKKFQDSEPLPIGKRFQNTDILILNSEDQMCNINEEGELCVRGSSLAMGYYNNLEKTNEVFVQNPLNQSYPEIIYRTGDIVKENTNNEIVFLGRKDTLVKHLGYRIELSEIEHIIVNVSKIVKNCCVIYNFEKKEIVLFYENLSELKTSEFKSELSKYLPKYMLPTKFYFYNELPRNLNGKIDRLHLKNLQY